MIELKPHLLDLLSADGLSGSETPVRELITAAWEPLVDQVSTSRIGSLHAYRKGSGQKPRPSLLLAAHMDIIGLIATRIVGEFVHVAPIGGIDPRVLPGQLVTIHGRKDLPGVIALPPERFQPRPFPGPRGMISRLVIDSGLSAKSLQQLVRPGDRISFFQPPVELGEKIITCRGLDNRASVAALTICLQFLEKQDILWDLWAVATTFEEVNLGGGATSAFDIQPSLAVAVDVTYAAGPGSPQHLTFPMGKGITLGWGPTIHPTLIKTFQNMADTLEIPYELEIMPRRSGTDADSMQVAASGIPTMVLSIPIRYMHTPVEMIDIKDIDRAGRLLAAFVTNLDSKFLEQLQKHED